MKKCIENVGWMYPAVWYWLMLFSRIAVNPVELDGFFSDGDNVFFSLNTYTNIAGVALHIINKENMSLKWKHGPMQKSTRLFS